MDKKCMFLGAVVLSYLVHDGATKSLDVVWISPTEGTTFSAGNTIVAKWRSTSPLVSPGFKLCAISGNEKGMSSAGLVNRGKDKEEGGKEEDGDGACGGTIWPKVQEVEDGYTVTITAPEALEMSEYCLEMQDDFGNVFTSPVFGLSGSTNDKASPPTSAASATTGSDAPTTSKDSASGAPKAVAETASHPTSHNNPNSSVQNATAPAPPRLAAPASTAGTLSSPQPDVLVSRRPVSTAAVAVPLSVVSAIILVAGLLWYRARRELAKERKRELKSLILSQKDSDRDGYGPLGEVQRTMSVLSRKGFGAYSEKPDAAPLFVAIKPEPRSTTRDPYTPMISSTSSHSVYDHIVPALHYGGADAVKGKSLTAQYTASGTLPSSESTPTQNLSFSSSMPEIPPNLLHARMPPLHVRTESPSSDRPLPRPPGQIHCLSSSGSTNVYDAIAAKLKGYQ